MSETDPRVRDHITRLRIALTVVGVIFMLGLLPLMHPWPSELASEHRHSEFEAILLGTFAVLGVFLLYAARNPMSHLSLIWFAAWFSLVHGGIGLIYSLINAAERTHLLGGVPVSIVIGAVLVWLTPRRSRLESTRPYAAGSDLQPAECDSPALAPQDREGHAGGSALTRDAKGVASE